MREARGFHTAGVGVPERGFPDEMFFSRFYEMMNTHDDTMSAPAAAGGKLRLSEIIAAVRANEVELDCKAVALFFDADGTSSTFDVDLVSVRDWRDVKFLLLYLGLQELAAQVMHDVPEAVAAVSAAVARGQSRDRLLYELGLAADDEEEVSEDGKEVCHEWQSCGV